MLNDREVLIQEILTRGEPPEPADGAGWACERPGDVGMTDLMDVALDRAPEELKARVEAHVRLCKFCRRALDVYRASLQAEDGNEPPVEGSLLELAAVGPTSEAVVIRSSPPGEGLANENWNVLDQISVPGRQARVALVVTGDLPERERLSAVSQLLRMHYSYAFTPGVSAGELSPAVTPALPSGSGLFSKPLLEKAAAIAAVIVAALVGVDRIRIGRANAGQEAIIRKLDAEIDYLQAEIEPRVEIVEPRDGQLVQEAENLAGHIRGGYPVILVRPVSLGVWYVQSPAEVNRGEFNTPVHFGDRDTPSGTKFQVVVAVTKSREQALEYRIGSTRSSLPPGLVRSETITVVRQ
jgi:hypothetical protein